MKIKKEKILEWYNEFIENNEAGIFARYTTRKLAGRTLQVALCEDIETVADLRCFFSCELDTSEIDNLTRDKISSEKIYWE